MTPRVAMLSFSNFGSVRDARSTMVADATALLRRRRPDLEVEGEMQANVAVDYTLMQSIFPSTQLTGPANVLIFPNLEAGQRRLQADARARRRAGRSARSCSAWPARSRCSSATARSTTSST